MPSLGAREARQQLDEVVGRQLDITVELHDVRVVAQMGGAQARVEVFAARRRGQAVAGAVGALVGGR